jgi:peptidyl-prolyl cis-trans isomerase C
LSRATNRAARGTVQKHRPLPGFSRLYWVEPTCYSEGEFKDSDEYPPMKSSLFFLLASSFAWAQTSAPPASAPSPATHTPSTAHPSSSSTPASSPSGANQDQLKVRGPVAVAQEDPNRVVAQVNGQNVTAAEALKMLQAMPSTEMQRFQQQGGGGLPTALQQLFMMRHLAEIAAQQHLDQKDPWKSQLAFYRDNMLAQAYVSQISNATNPSSQEMKSYFDQHPQEFQDAKLSAIIINFTPAGAAAAPNSPGAKTEEQAKAKADLAVKKIRAGTSFADVVKTDSDHKPSAEKGGELGTFTPDKLPKEISDPVFKLKPGEVTDPIREANGFYILKLDSLAKKTFEQAQSDIVTTLKQEQVRKTLDQTNQQYQVQVKDAAFFNLPGTAGAATPSLERPTHASPGQPKAAPAK